MRSKLARFAENKQRLNVIEPGKPIFTQIKGQWSSFFGNSNPITLELGCGHGEYTVGLAKLNADQNFIGVDVKGARIWKGSKEAEESGIANVAFLRIRMLDLENFFEKYEVSEIWITFPDPRPKEKDEKRRLTSPRFLDIYRMITKPNSVVHLKTDNQDLYDYTLEKLGERDDIKGLDYTTDLYQSTLYGEPQRIVTTFEQKFSSQGIPIKYLRFQFS